MNGKAFRGCKVESECQVRAVCSYRGIIMGPWSAVISGSQALGVEF